MSDTKGDEREARISYLAKEELCCPVCRELFHREEPLSGSGRLIAGQLTDELRRLYEPSAKYGDVYPLAYQATVCPSCWFAAPDKDFSNLPDDRREQAAADKPGRFKETALLFPDVDFGVNRDLVSGAASQYLVLRCLDFYPPEYSPTLKQAIAALRAGWLLDTMNEKFPNQHYDWTAKLFKKKAQFFYHEAARREQAGEETMSAVTNFGPDTDKNYGYEGALYLDALLTYKYCFKGRVRAAALDEAKRALARIFGVGKSSKAKPGPLLDHVRRLYDLIANELQSDG